MMKNNKIIISGPPGSGKTTIIHELLNRNYLIKNEVNPLRIIDKGLSKLELSDCLFKARIQDYQDVNFYNKKKMEKIVFFDRSIIDVIGYMNFWKKKYPLKWHQEIDHYRYRRDIFYTPSWKEIYQTTEERPETYQNAKKIDLFLREAFLKFNYNIIEVPKLNTNQRVNFILDNI